MQLRMGGLTIRIPKDLASANLVVVVVVAVVAVVVVVVVMM